MGFFSSNDDEDLKPVKPKPVKQKPRRLCDGLRRDLKLCLLDTECVQKERRLPIDCLKALEAPEQCIKLAREFFECKRQYVDTRKRFRGNRGY